MLEQGQFLRHAVYFQDGLSDLARRNLLYLVDDAFGDVPRPVSSPNNALRDVIARRELSRGFGLGAVWMDGNSPV